MHSINAQAVNFILKYMIKPLQAHAPINPPVMKGVRNVLEVASRAVFRAPSHIATESVHTEGPSGMVAGEWLVSDRVTDHDRVILYFHGGGYFFGSSYTHRPLIWRISMKSQTRVFALDYRRVPEHSVADCCEDAVNAYQWLLAEGYTPENIMIGGDSAGGGLVLLALLALKNKSLPLPRAAICLSPFADMSQTSPSLISNARTSHMFHPNALRKMEQYLTDDTESGDSYDPAVSPAFGDHEGLPPLFLQVADSELLYHDSLLVAKNMLKAGVKVELNIWHDLPHVFTLFSDFVPEWQKGIQQIADFIVDQFAAA